MKKIKCENCGKVIEGYTEDHVNFLMRQHSLSNKCKRRKNESNSTRKK